MSQIGKTVVRSDTLDILRAVAIILVLGRHMLLCPADVNIALHHVTLVWHQGGWIGVDLFFVLSGFLISGLLFKEHQNYGRIALKDFFIRRGLKIYPAYLVFILATVLKTIFEERKAVDFELLINQLLFLQN